MVAAVFQQRLNEHDKHSFVSANIAIKQFFSPEGIFAEKSAKLTFFNRSDIQLGCQSNSFVVVVVVVVVVVSVVSVFCNVDVNHFQ